MFVQYLARLHGEAIQALPNLHSVAQKVHDVCSHFDAAAAAAAAALLLVKMSAKISWRHSSMSFLLIALLYTEASVPPQLMNRAHWGPQQVQKSGCVELWYVSKY